MNSNNLPSGWGWTRLGEIIAFEYGKGLIADKREQNGNIPVYGSNGIVGYHSIPLIKKPCLIIGRKGAAGYVHISKVPCWAIDTTYFIIPPDELNLVFLYFLLSTLNLNSLDKSTAIPGLNRNDAYALEIPLPPLPEQRAIVSKIEQLFSDLDNGIENFKKAQAQLKIYRHAVLKYAFEGKLTEDWRAVHKNEMEPASVLLEHIKDETKKDAKRKFKELPPIDTRMLPEGWVYGKLEHLIYIAGRIGWRGLKAEEYTKEGPLFLSVYNLNKGNYVDFSEVYHISEERYDESPEIQLKNDDILLVKDGSGIGKLGIVKGLKTKATVNSSLLVIRSGKFFVPEYLFYFLKGPNMQRVVKERITGSATPHLFQRDIKKFELLIPPIKEQKKIVEEIERRLSVCDKMEATITESLQKAESLRQSILKKAFEGKLLNKKELEKARKASDWEPAEKLLERIKAEKMSIKTTNKDKK